jgi:hypothetical protein
MSLDVRKPGRNQMALLLEARAAAPMVFAVIALTLLGVSLAFGSSSQGY